MAHGRPQVRTGLMRLMAGEVVGLSGKRVGLLMNPTAVDDRLVHAVDALDRLGGTRVTVLFGPEHGVRGDAQDMISVGTATDELTGLPMISLYGHDEASLRPTPEMLQGLDAVIYDVQDVGARYYTFVWTLLHMMEACAPLGIQVIVLDRPNPIGGAAVEGGAIEPGYESFVGRLSIPNRHGMTAGEIARMVNERCKLGCALTVVDMVGWTRDFLFGECGLPWIAPSPNMPSPATALVYPGMCLIEGTELSEARGTTLPFEQVGASYVNFAGARALADLLAKQDLPGIHFRPLVYTPTFHKFAHEPCGGVFLHVTDPRAFLPYLTGVAVCWAFRQLFPDDFEWRAKAYEFVDTVPAIDLLCGSDQVRVGIDSDKSLSSIASTWAAAESAFKTERGRWLAY